jgi:hypothetical protein
MMALTITTIASAFPGQFSYVELLNLDVRDLTYWFKAAQKKILTNRIWAIHVARLAMAADKTFTNVVGDLEGQLREIDVGKNSLIKENWDDLKRMRRG